MAFKPKEEFYSLAKHDFDNIHACASAATQDGEYREHWVEDYREEMESLVGGLEAAIDNLDVEKDERPDLDDDVFKNLRRYEPEDFHPEFSSYVMKINQLAGLAMESYDNFERQKDYQKGWIQISDIFQPFEGKVDYNGHENDVIRGDGSLACVINTLEDNSDRHGGENVNTYAAVNPGSEGIIHKHLSSKKERGESENRWIEANTEREYTILVWDDGKGLDNHRDIEEIFRREEGENSGLGLPISQEIIQHYDGEMKALSQHPEIPEQSGLIISMKLPGTPINTRLQ